MTPNTREEIVEIQDTYDKEGFWVKRTVNDVPVFVPKQMAPVVQIITPDTEWFMEKKFMTKKEFENKYLEMFTPPDTSNK